MDVTQYTPAQVKDLRSRGVLAVGAAAGREPGTYIEHPDGIRGVRLEIDSRLPGDIPSRSWWLKLLTAIVWEESHGDTRAVSETGALGAFQLTSFIYGEDPGKRYSAINPFQWGPAQIRAREEMRSLMRRAHAEPGPQSQALRNALAGWKEGWSGSRREDRRPRGLAYADRVISIMSSL